MSSLCVTLKQYDGLWSRFPLGKHLVMWLIKKFHLLSRRGNFATAVTRNMPDKVHSHALFDIILILSSHLLRSLLTQLFLSSIQTDIFFTFLFMRTCLLHVLWSRIIYVNNDRWTVQISNFYSIFFRPLSSSSSSMALQPGVGLGLLCSTPPSLSRSLALSLRSFIPIFLRSVDMSSNHLIFGLPLSLVAYSFPYILFGNLMCGWPCIVIQCG